MTRDELRVFAKALDKDLKKLEDGLAKIDKKNHNERLKINVLWKSIEAMERKVGLL